VKERRVRRKAVLFALVLVALALLSARLIFPVYGPGVRQARESILRQDLKAMRLTLNQYVLDNHRRPGSLDDLVAAGYLKQIPADPMTGRTDTWVVEWSDDPTMPGIVSMHSGSRTASSKGNLYSDW